MNIEYLDNYLSKNGIIFLSYVGFVSQDLISNMTEVLENEVNESKIDLTMSTNIFTTFIELSQNIMNYGKSTDNDIEPKGLVLVGNVDGQYYVLSRNLVDEKDKLIIEKRLKKILSQTQEEIKDDYRLLRKNSAQKHEKGAGLGFLEIAKRCDSIEYSFKEAQDNKYNFSFKANIKTSLK